MWQDSEKMKDSILRGMLCDGEISVMIACTSETVRQAERLLNTNEPVTIALGRLLTAGAIMAQRIKGTSEKLTIIINGGGPAGKLMITANCNGEVKGCVDNPQALPSASGKNAPSEAVVGNKGNLTIIRDMGFGMPYTGVAPLVSGGIAEDIAAYFTFSEQQPAAVILGVDIDSESNDIIAGGIFFMPMPDCSNASIEALEKKILKLPPISKMLTYYLSLEEMLFDLFWDIGAETLEENAVNYCCDCSRNRIEEVLLSLGVNELNEIKGQNTETEICCHFCNKKYIFLKGDIELLMEKAKL